MTTVDAVRSSAVPASGVQYAGFGVRLAAYLIDLVILIAVYAVVAIGLAAATDAATAASLTTLIAGTAQIIYFVHFWGSRGATPGKKLLKLRVKIKDMPHYGPGIGNGKAFLRLIGYTVSSITFFLGFLMVFANAERRGLHDYLAGTIVVRE